MVKPFLGYEPYHVLYFEPSTLARTTVSAGYQVVRSWTLDPFSVWFLALLRTLRPPRRDVAAPARAVPPSSAVEHTYRVVMVASGLLTWPLRWLQGRLGKGDELLMVARRLDG